MTLSQSFQPPPGAPPGAHSPRQPQPAAQHPRRQPRPASPWHASTPYSASFPLSESTNARVRARGFKGAGSFAGAA